MRIISFRQVGFTCRLDKLDLGAPNDSSALRRALRIRCTGDQIPDIWPTFSSFPALEDIVLENLANMGAVTPTPIQMQASSIIHSRLDLLACAPTGSGKTLAFLLPLLMLSHSHGIRKGVTALIVEPTRELARQVYTEACKIKGGTDWQVSLLGDSEMTISDSALHDDTVANLLIVTPLKLVYALKEQQVDLSNVQHIVLDEVDRYVNQPATKFE